MRRFADAQCGADRTVRYAVIPPIIVREALEFRVRRRPRDSGSANYDEPARVVGAQCGKFDVIDPLAHLLGLREGDRAGHSRGAASAFLIDAAGVDHQLVAVEAGVAKLGRGFLVKSRAVAKICPAAAAFLLAR